MNIDDFELVNATADRRAEFVEMALEYQAAGEDRHHEALVDFSGFMARLDRFETGAGLPPHLVPSTMFWLVGGGRILGTSHLRHRLNENLSIEGGHIGYDIRPLQRRKGYGTLILRMTLPKAAEKGIHTVLITCDTDNTASRKIIEKNGGIFRCHAISPRTGRQISQYWIKT